MKLKKETSMQQTVWRHAGCMLAESLVGMLNKPSRQTMGGYGNATAVCKLKNRQNTY